MPCPLIISERHNKVVFFYRNINIIANLYSPYFNKFTLFPF